MCGIAGIFPYLNSRTVDTDNLIAMRDGLRHRGPDGEGIFVNNTHTIGLASTRLAIQDLSGAGHQPFVDTKTGVAIVFNGEVYNAKALRQSLQNKGVVFSSLSDTEVLLRLYCDVGEDLLQMVNGIYAFAIWDERARSLFIARDPLGVKPIYFADHQGTVVFASEAKALLRSSELPPLVDHSAIATYLTFSCSPGPDTLFQHVKKLPPATSLTVTSRAGLVTRRYWRPINASLSESMAGASEGECVEALRGRLKIAVRDQLIGEVPVTCSLSGGVDSSAIAALISEYSSKRMTYFTIGFADEWAHHNEFTHARRVADRVGADLVELRVTSDDVLEFMQSRFAEACDDPNADPVCSLAFFLSKEMRRHGFKVAMSGEGSDEIFLGYDHYLQALARYETQTDAGTKFSDEYWGTAIGFREDDLRKILNSDFASRYYDPVNNLVLIQQAHRESLSVIEDTDLVRRVSALELQIRLPELLLMRVDKMMMANSVECRVPFLDKEVVELAFAIRADVKIGGRQPKSVVKKAVEGIIPTENIHRKKMGFQLPIAEWFESEKIGPQFTDLILNSNLVRSGVLDRNAVSKLIAEHRNGTHNRYFKLWSLLTLSLWYERWAS
jgi:asparagine synthase (glutamine-hydrolysing)